MPQFVTPLINDLLPVCGGLDLDYIAETFVRPVYQQKLAFDFIITDPKSIGCHVEGTLHHLHGVSS